VTWTSNAPRYSPRREERRRMRPASHHRHPGRERPRPGEARITSAAWPRSYARPHRRRTRLRQREGPRRPKHLPRLVHAQADPAELVTATMLAVRNHRITAGLRKKTPPPPPTRPEDNARRGRQRACPENPPTPPQKPSPRSRPRSLNLAARPAPRQQARTRTPSRARARPIPEERARTAKGRLGCPKNDRFRGRTTVRRKSDPTPPNVKIGLTENVKTSAWKLGI